MWLYAGIVLLMVWLAIVHLALRGQSAAGRAHREERATQKAVRRRLASTRAGRRQMRLDRLAIASIYLFILGTLVYRIRSSSDIASEAVDGAAAIRLGWDCVAGLTAGLAFLQTPRPPERRGQLSPLVSYFWYALTASLGAIVAANPGLVGFRIFEMMIVVMIVSAASRRLSLDRMIVHAQGILFFHAGLITFGAIAFPSRAFWHAYGGILPFRLEGAFPMMSYNTVGAIGVFLMAVGLGAKWVPKFTVGSGVALVILAQYRTGYVAVAAVLFTWLMFRKGGWSKFAAFLVVPAIILFTQTNLFTDAWQRGEQNQGSLETLSGRTVIWQKSIEIANQHPFTGVGLSSGLRFEVSHALGIRETISTAHGGWVEAYLGTGIIGTSLIGLTLLLGVIAAIRIRSVTMVPLLVSAAVVVRTITATTIELPGWPALIWLLLVMGAWAYLRGERPLNPKQAHEMALQDPNLHAGRDAADADADAGREVEGRRVARSGNLVRRL